MRVRSTRMAWLRRINVTGSTAVVKEEGVRIAAATDGYGGTVTVTYLRVSALLVTIFSAATGSDLRPGSFGRAVAPASQLLPFS